MSRNGFLTDDELTPVQGDIQLPNEAAFSYLAFVDAARRARKNPSLSPLAGGYRSYAMQADMYRNPAKYNASSGVASPGHSAHGQAPGCIDLAYWDSFGDLVGIGKRRYSRGLDEMIGPFGWRRTIATEGWHYQFFPTSGGGGGFRPKPTHVGDGDMPDLYALSGSKPRLYARAGGNPGTPANWIEATDPSVSAGWLPKNNDGVPVGSFTDLSQGTWDSFKAKYLAPVQFVGGGSGSAPADAVTKADLAAAEGRITAEVHGVPAAVVVENKKPGN